MLGGRAQRALGIAEHGGEFGRRDGAHVGAHFAVRPAVWPRRTKTMPVFGLGGKHVQGGRSAGMNADTADGDRGAKRGLPASLHSSCLPPHANARAAPPDPQHPSISPVKCRKVNLRQIAGPPSPGKIPFCCEHFRRGVNHRQLTLSYRLLPFNRRKAPKRGLCHRPSAGQTPEHTPFRGFDRRFTAAEQLLKTLR